jgi:multidrug efflux pump subunit AcrA (membrane-fusion protein)
MSMRNRLTGLAAGIGILSVGLFGMLGLASVRKPPAEALVSPGADAIRVETVPVQPEDVTVTLTGYGEVASVRIVEIASEVSGSVIETHPRLVVGGIVREGERIAAIDTRPYAAAVDQARARSAELDSQAKRLEAERANDLERMVTLKRNVDLARSRFDRAKKLYEQAIGDKTELETAERFVHDAEDAARLLHRQIDVYPLRLEEIRQQRAAQQAIEAQAQLNLSYCDIRAPFAGRVVEVFVERGQYAALGRPIARIADDSALEIPVKLDAQEARAWLRFAENSPDGDLAWFAGLEPVTCEVRWAGDANGPLWQGTLDRVDRFDADTRTLGVVVRVSAQDALGSDGALPLVAGMFCEVRVPGRILRDVFRLPQGAITVDRTVHIALGGVLQSLPVEIVRREGDWALVRGIAIGDRLITTRLVNALDGMPLDIAAPRPDTE